MKEKVVVFGATGTVGAYTCLYLAEIPASKNHVSVHPGF